MLKVVIPRCKTCEGDGVITYEMHFFLMFITCDDCRAVDTIEKRLKLKIKDKNISDVLNMTVDENVIFLKI